MIRTAEFRVSIDGNGVETSVIKLQVPLIKKTIQCAGEVYFKKVTKSSKVASVSKPKAVPKSVKLNEELSEDDYRYLASLDPVDFKNQDHYAVLGKSSPILLDLYLLNVDILKY